MSRDVISAVVVFFVIVAAGIILMLTGIQTVTQQNLTPSPTVEQTQQTQQSDQSLLKEIKITDEKVGTGAIVKTGNTVTVNYIGTLQNGTKFDSSYDRNQPFTFALGAGQVIKGWDLGVVGMRVRGKRKLVIPPDLGYGNQQTSKIPPNSTLIFEIELLSVK